jgi:hypothetical protein
MQSRAPAWLVLFGLLSPIWPEPALRAQSLALSPWGPGGGCFYPIGDTIRCDGDFLDPEADHTRVRMRVIAAVRGSGSRCGRCSWVRSTLTVGPAGTRVRVVARARGERRNDVATSRGNGTAYAYLEGGQIDWRFDVNSAGTESFSRADSFETCLRAGTYTLETGLSLDVYGSGQPGLDTFASDFFSGPAGGLEIEVRNLGTPPTCNPGPYFIGVFADAAGTRCNIPAPIGTLGTFYILAVGSASPPDFSGAEFRVDGFPPGWVATVTPSPLAWVSLGNPLQGGCIIAFAACPQTSVVLLYTVSFQVWSVVQAVPLSVRPHVPCLDWPCCPFWVRCDGPVFTKVCLPDVETAAFLNGSFDPCWVGVLPATWTRVKELYRH